MKPVGRWRLDVKPIYRYLIHGLVKLVYNPVFIGFDKLPDNGPAIIVCNHVSYVDGPVVDTAFKRMVRYVIDDEIYEWPVVNHIMKMARAIPIAPRRDSVEAALDEISNGLKNGDVICIFPEGLLTYTGSLGRFKPGIEHIVKRDPVPVYPVAIHGLWGSIFSRKNPGSWKRFLPFNRKGRVMLICGDAVPPEEVNVNYLQEIVLRLKYSLDQQGYPQ